MIRSLMTGLGCPSRRRREDDQKGIVSVAETLSLTPSRTAAKTNHPDVGGSEEKMAAINEAYEVLSDSGVSLCKPCNRPTDSPQSCDSDMTTAMIPMIPLADSSTIPLRTTGGSQVGAVGSRAGVEDKSSISSGEVEDRFACIVLREIWSCSAQCIAMSSANVVDSTRVVEVWFMVLSHALRGVSAGGPPSLKLLMHPAFFNPLFIHLFFFTPLVVRLQH
jgi:hypothetical protein